MRAQEEEKPGDLDVRPRPSETCSIDEDLRFGSNIHRFHVVLSKHLSWLAVSSIGKSAIPARGHELEAAARALAHACSLGAPDQCDLFPKCNLSPEIL